jgi:hypothetical protein
VVRNPAASSKASASVAAAAAAPGPRGGLAQGRLVRRGPQQMRGDLAASFGCLPGERAEGRGGAAVQRGALVFAEAGVYAVADQGMAEPPRARAVRHSGDEPAGLGFGQGRQHSLAAAADRGGQLGAELRAQHARRRQQPACALVQAAGQRRDQVADLRAGPRDPGHRVGVGCGLRTRGQHPGQRRHVQRIALRPCVHHPRQVRIRGQAGRRQDLADGGLGERGERHHLQAGQPGQVSQRGPPGITAGIPAGGQHEQPGGGQFGRELPQQEQRGVVGPVQVLEHDEQAGLGPGGGQGVGRRRGRAEPDRSQVIGPGAAPVAGQPVALARAADGIEYPAPRPQRRRAPVVDGPAA